MASVGSHVFPRQIQLEVSCSFGKANVTFDKGLSSSLADIAFSVGDGSAFSIVVLIVNCRRCYIDCIRLVG